MNDAPRPDGRLPAAAALRLEEACARFEADWRAGGRPRLEDFLGPADAPERPALLRELVALDVHYRLQAGESPRPEDYVGRLPGLGAADCASAFAAAGTAVGRPGSPEGPPAPPPLLADYEVLGELGRGAMGVVYRARQRGLNRLVALKMIRAGDLAGPEERLRFLAEAKAVAALQHPHVVQIGEVGQHAGSPFLALEYVEGGSLADRLRAAPLPPREAARLVQTLAGAVQAAHARGIVHRDLKPANVLLDGDGVPKITDFGLAKRLEGGAGLTESGAIVGTPSYMAPEQAGGKGKEAGPAADVYALGAILYECVTGRPPFRGASPLDTVLQVLREEPVSPPGGSSPRCPPTWRRSC
jgi:serine/threonine protein kinase